MRNLLPSENTMYNAMLKSDGSYDGIFFVAVKTTGIFCRPSCRVRKPKRENVEYYKSTRDALLNGYRPCKKCRPLESKGAFPEWLKGIAGELADGKAGKITDGDLKKKGVDPNRVRRWFKTNMGMTFQAYQRTLRINGAFGRIRYGDKVIEAAYDSGYDSLSGFTSSFKKATGFTPEESRRKKLITVTRILTPLGPMIAAAADEGICLLEFADRRMLETQLKRIRRIFKAEVIPGQSLHFEELNRQMKEYFDGKRKEFDLPLLLDGTPFQNKVWEALLGIPYGKTRSYKRQAEIIKQPSAVRAVAKANGDNRIAIIVPCHRVIGSDGSLTGYGGGLWRKQYLLDLEMKNI